MTLQTINLVDHLDRQQTLPYSSTHIAWASAAITIAMAVICLIFWVYSFAQDRRIPAIEKRIASLANELSTMRASATISPQQQKQLEDLRAMRKQKSELLASISQKRAAVDGFSVHMEGLGRQYIQGLWLQHIGIKADGSSVVLKGMMREPSLLPKYLQGLSEERVFKGMRFQLMKIEHDSEKSKQMFFEIAADSELRDSALDERQS